MRPYVRSHTRTHVHACVHKGGISANQADGMYADIARWWHDFVTVRSTSTARIQEAQIFLGHFILENVENKLIKKK